LKREDGIVKLPILFLYKIKNLAMKKILLLLTIFISTFSFSQDIEVVKKGKKYFFTHTLDMTEERKERYIFRIKQDNLFVKNLSIKGESVSIIFDKSATDEQIKSSLDYCTRVFNIESYKLIK